MPPFSRFTSRTPVLCPIIKYSGGNLVNHKKSSQTLGKRALYCGFSFFISLSQSHCSPTQGLHPNADIDSSENHQYFSKIVQNQFTGKNCQDTELWHCTRRIVGPKESFDQTLRQESDKGCTTIDGQNFCPKTQNAVSYTHLTLPTTPYV